MNVSKNSFLVGVYAMRGPTCIFSDTGLGCGMIGIMTLYLEIMCSLNMLAWYAQRHIKCSRYKLNLVSDQLYKIQFIFFCILPSVQWVWWLLIRFYWPQKNNEIENNNFVWKIPYPQSFSRAIVRGSSVNLFSSFCSNDYFTPMANNNSSFYEIINPTNLSMLER
jgi:hypothetical protein